MAQDWTRIEGMIIGHDLDPSVVAGELKDRSILAQLEWFPSSPQMLGLNVAVDKERVATVPAGSTEVVPGPTPAELADELAILFDAEVRIGNATADHLPEGDSPLGKVWPSDEEDAAAVEPIPTRIVEIGRTPASSVPLLAALEGVDLGDLELAEGHRASAPTSTRSCPSTPPPTRVRRRTASRTRPGRRLSPTPSFGCL